MSARISGVKNFVSQKISLVRGLPLSQVQSQSEKGSIFFFWSGAASCVGAAEVAAATVAPAGLAADGVPGGGVMGKLIASSLAACFGFTPADPSSDAMMELAGVEAVP